MSRNSELTKEINRWHDRLTQDKPLTGKEKIQLQHLLNLIKLIVSTAELEKR